MPSLLGPPPPQQIIFYSANFMIGALMLHATDAGGTMFIHTFGAYFGVALAFFLSPKVRRRA